MASNFIRFFTNNWGLKITAILLALMSFYAIRGVTSKEGVYEVPIEVERRPQVAILDKDPPTVRVQVRGSLEDLSMVDSSKLKAVVRPKASDPAGRENVPIHPRDIAGISGARVVSVQPGSVTLTFDHADEKMIPVMKPEMQGLPMIGKAQLQFNPKEVKVVGPKRALEKEQFVTTEKVDVTDRAASFTTRVKVLPPHGTGVTRIEPPEITVRVEIVTEAITRQFTNVMIHAVLAPSSKAPVYFTPDVVTVSLNGRAELLDKIPRDSIKVFVDCVGLEAGAEYELPVDVHIRSAEDVAATVEPRVVKVSLGPPVEKQPAAQEP